MNPLVDKYRSEIEGFISDLCEDLPLNEHRDAVEDFASDYIREWESSADHEQVSDAAREIAEYYFG